MQTNVRVSPKLTRRLIREMYFCETRLLEVPWGEGWPSTCASSRRRIVGPSPSAITTRDKWVVVIVIVIFTSPARTSLRLPIGSCRLATLLAFDAFPTDRTSVGVAQPLLEHNAMSAMRYNKAQRGNPPPNNPGGTNGSSQLFSRVRHQPDTKYPAG